MPKLETIEDFYKETVGWMPDSLRGEIGHFNVFKSEPYVGVSAKPLLISVEITIKSLFFMAKAK